MEFRCRVATATGQVSELTYVAENETRLRHELEEKGMFVLSVQRGGGVSVGGLRMPRRRTIPQNDFILFNQELATLLKAGLPLVQSLDILRKRVQLPLFRTVLDDIYEKVRGGTALFDDFPRSAHPRGRRFDDVIASVPNMRISPREGRCAR